MASQRVGQATQNKGLPARIIAPDPLLLFAVVEGREAYNCRLGNNCDMNLLEKAVEDKTPSKLSLLRHTGVIIPTYNASRFWDHMHAALQVQGLDPDQVLIVDSSSTDDTRTLAQRAGYRVIKIPTENFRHGATRQMAADVMSGAEILIFLTQDAIPCGSNSFETLLNAFNNAEVGACYGRQLPRHEANSIERHARLFNYPDHSDLRTFDSRKQLGIKAAFFSNSFAAYRRVALEQVGGFPVNTIVSEEVTVAARMLMARWKISYQADAVAIHSHSLTIKQEFSRYFDIGVHHGREHWLIDEFGGTGGEGRAFIWSEAKYLLKTQPYLIPLATIRNLSKWCSYQLGRHERHLSQAMKESISAQPNYWKDQRTAALTTQSRVAMPTS